MIQIKSLCLRNFRCFDECEISFHPELTVLVARNGQGKSALLDAIATAFGLFVDTVSGIPQERRIEWSDVRRIRHEERGMIPAGDVEFRAAGIIDDRDMQWGRKRRGDLPSGRTSRKDAKQLTTVAEELRERLGVNDNTSQQHAELPLVAYYGTGRQWENDRNNSQRPNVSPSHERCFGYENCLSSSSPFALFTEWYATMLRNVADTPVVGIQKENRPEKLLAAVIRAVDAVLKPETRWSGLDWHSEEQILLLSHPVHGTLPLAYLSDGIRNTVALVADVAHRCARLNPHFGDEAAMRTAGILLIDEIDLHLHPEWQQLVVNSLRTVFPRMQLILTTHSPQVLSTVYADQIRIIRQSENVAVIQEPRFQTRGVESADVLAAIMGVDPIPQVAEAQWLSDYRAAIEQGEHESPHFQQLRESLESHFGSQHPLMLDCERLIRFAAFKKQRESDGGSHAQA
jgi:predicted ATP-binding protein involved in virulence